jgi:hypothetical protein
MRSAQTKIALLTIACEIFFVSETSAEDCRNSQRAARAAIVSQVAALQRLEHEASDRVKGLDSRPFDVLRDEARKLTAIIADPEALKREEGLATCRNRTVAVRTICVGAARHLVDILAQHVAHPKPDYDKPRYAGAMAACERLMDLKPLKSGIRGTD